MSYPVVIRPTRISAQTEAGNPDRSGYGCAEDGSQKKKLEDILSPVEAVRAAGKPID
jgi:hypothetical protein